MERDFPLERNGDVDVLIASEFAGRIVVFDADSAGGSCGLGSKGDDCLKWHEVFGHPVALSLAMALADNGAAWPKYLNREAGLKIPGATRLAGDSDR